MHIVTCTTNGISVSVKTQYEAEHSNPSQNRYVHSYTITIENKSDHTVQLISRHWVIMDNDMNVREVRGEGVVGEQPILQPGASYTYSSWSPISTEIGKMSGSYQMIRTVDNEKFDVRVPVFVLCNFARFN